VSRAGPERQLGNTVMAGLASGGRPLDDATRAVLETGFGNDLAHVRVHDDGAAARSAAALNADAFSVGHDIVMGAGARAAGPRLLAHEVAHVLQRERGAGSAPATLATPREAEREAAAAGEAVAAGRTAEVGARIGAGVVARQEFGYSAKAETYTKDQIADIAAKSTSPADFKSRLFGGAVPDPYLFEFLKRKGFSAEKPPARAEQQAPASTPASGGSWWSTALAVAELGFTLIVGRTPGQVWDQAMAATVEPVLTIYGPSGMLDQAAQKVVDRAMGVDKPDEAYTTPAEHRKQLDAIISVGGFLFPELEVSPPAIRRPPTLVTSEGVVVSGGSATVTAGATVTIEEAGILAKTGGGLASSGGKGGGSSGGGDPSAGGPGRYVMDFEGGTNMSSEAGAYDVQVTKKKHAGLGYYVAGVQFDGFLNGVLIEAKYYLAGGRQASRIEDFDRHVGNALLKQARRQKAVAGQYPVVWKVADKPTADIVQQLFDKNRVRIRVDFEAPGFTKAK
jgi:hypothetical protein